MVTTTIIANPQTRVKDTYACSPTVGLTVRANGEEITSLINANGSVSVQAGILPPSDPPTINDPGGAATPSGLISGKWISYGYVYAATVDYPFVESLSAIDGSLAPRSNPTVFQSAWLVGGNGGNTVVFVGNRTLQVTVTYTTRADISKIWLFRTNYFSSSIEAFTAAQAGQIFFIAEIPNNTAGGTVVYNDSTQLTGVDQVEEDNFVAPTFQFVVYYDPYWWGFGNFPFTAVVTWATVAGKTLVTLTNAPPDQWFTGRNGQNITLSGVSSSGFDGIGTYKFLWVSLTTAYITLDGTIATAQTITPSSGAQTATVQGPAVTLYRSKPRNPFAWGFTEIIGTANVPQEYAFKVGGGLGTALAVIPNTGLLKLDTEYPTHCYTLNLRLAGTQSFEQSLRIISEQFSTSSHWSQFQAVSQNGISVLWSIDYKNFAILQCNGATLYPISGPIPVILRRLSQDKSKQLSCHGIYDARTELNCLWVTTNDSLSQVNFLIYQHAPTGFWGFMDEHDLLCSASIQDTLTGENKTFVGTQAGFFGTAFVSDLFNNWLPATGIYTGNFTSATNTSITISPILGSFNIVDAGIIGNWCLVTDVNNQTEQWARISAVTAQTLTFDAIFPYAGGITTAFNPSPQAGGFFYIGMIECMLEKRYDLDIPTIQKTVSEFWVTQINLDNPMLVRFFRELRTLPELQFSIAENTYLDLTNSDTWVSRIAAPNLQSYSFGFKMIQRGYLNYKLVNYLFKTKDANT